MGCDIHIHIEVKVDGCWEHYAAPNVGRNYSMFEKMAGVRGDEENAISPPKGLPDDMSHVTEKSAERWGGDGHSHSWLSLPEIAELSDWLSDNPDNTKTALNLMARSLEYDVLHTYLEGNSFKGFLNYPEDRPDWIEDVRFIFWFDN